MLASRLTQLASRQKIHARRLIKYYKLNPIRCTLNAMTNIFMNNQQLSTSNNFVPLCLVYPLHM